MTHVTSQGSSKVHKMNANYGSSEVKLKVHDGAVLEYLPGPVILYADSRYLQNTDIEVGDGSTVFYSETVVPGRLARGEEFQFELYQSDLTVRDCSGRLLFRDRVIINPKNTDLGKQGVMGGYRILGNFYMILIGIDYEQTAKKVRGIIKEFDDILGGVTHLPNNCGILFRVLGMDTEPVNKIIARVWDGLRQDVLGASAPNLRKY
jgi:urease accessory protein